VHGGFGAAAVIALQQLGGNAAVAARLRQQTDRAAPSTAG
jgi:hypothetical protein